MSGEQQQQQVHKPLCDRRNYQYAVLDNGLRVLAIQDTADAAFAAVCANVQVLPAGVLVGVSVLPCTTPHCCPHFLTHLGVQPLSLLLPNRLVTLMTPPTSCRVVPTSLSTWFIWAVQPSLMRGSTRRTSQHMGAAATHQLVSYLGVREGGVKGW